MTGTAVPSPSLGPTGFTAPAEGAILTGVETDFNSALGGNLTFANGSPELQLATSNTAIIGDGNDQFLALAYACDPAFASGRNQDALARIYFLTRIPSTATLVTCTCTGTPGRFIGTGSIAIDTAGNLYYCTAGGTIGGGGTVSLTFACGQTGPIACPAGTLTTIYRALSGWDSITNPADGVLGRNVESRQAFEIRRQESVQANALGVIGAIIGQVSQVSGVTDWYGYDNATASTPTVGGVTMVANSIYVCALGGTDLAVAQAILSKKGGGCAYTGGTTVTAYDNNPLYGSPVAYSVKFQRPTATPIKFAVSITNSTGVPSDYLTQVQNAIIAAFGGGDGGPRARIGTIIYASRFYAPVAALGPWAAGGLISILVGTSTATLNDVVMQINQNPTITSGNISVSLV